MEINKIIDTGEELHYFKHPNGFRVYVWQNKLSHDANFSINVNYGALYYQYKINNKIVKDKTGIAHFLEHVMFNISKDEAASDTFSKLGTYENAYTDTKNTCYYIFAQNDYETNLNTLLRMVFTPYFTKKLVDQEKGIIIEEKRRSNNNPYNIFFEKYQTNLYHYANYRETTLGTLADIRAITATDLKRVYKTFYHPANMELVVTGNVNPYEIERIVNEFFKDKEFEPFKNPESYWKKEPFKVLKTYEEITGNVEIPKIRLGAKIPLKILPDLPMKELKTIIRMILRNNYGKTSDLREELLDKELISSLAAGYSFQHDYLIINIASETKYPQEVLEIIKDKLNHLSITEKDFKRKINSAIGTYVTLYDSNEIVGDEIVNDLVLYRDFDYNVMDMYKNIKYQDVLDVLKTLDFKNQLEVVLLPKKK